MKVPPPTKHEAPQEKQPDWCRICRKPASPGCYVNGKLLPPREEEQ